jgi:hypothetical protein
VDSIRRRDNLLTLVVNEHKSGGLQSLKRFGTLVSGRRKSQHPYGRASSPDRKSSTNLGAAFSGFGKGKSKDRDTPTPAPERPGSPMRRISSARDSEASASPRQTRQSSSEKPNGTLSPEPTNEPARPSSATNGATHDTIPELKEPLSRPPPAALEPEVVHTHFSWLRAPTNASIAREGRGRFHCAAICH